MYHLLIPERRGCFGVPIEPDGAHRDFSYVLDRAGFRRIAHEPTLRDPNFPERVGVSVDF
jgi:hypothetical protein